jgi:probable HAF family extracellular repeat protein
MALWNTWNRITRPRAAHLGSRRRPARGQPSRRPCLEVLEDRCLLSSYKFTDLGTLGGPNSFASAINGAGEVVGRADTQLIKNPYSTGNPYRPFLWKPSVPNGPNGSMTDLDPGSLGIDPTATGINGPGQVVGDEFVNDNDLQAFLWTPAAPDGTSGGAVVLGTLGGTDSHALGINGSGQVVGWSYTTSGPSLLPRYAFLWTPATPNGTSGTMAQLPTLSGTPAGSANGINDLGQVVGAAGSAAFLYSGGNMIDLGGLGNIPESSDAYGINNLGQVVGNSALSTNNDHAFLWTPATPNGTSGTMIDLGSLGGGNSYATAINRAGQVVGDIETSSGLQHAFLWTPTTPNGTTGTMVDLNTLINANNVSLEYASGINDQGQIVGYGLFNKNVHAFLLTPASKAQAASSTPTTPLASPTIVTSNGTPLALILASPPSDSTSFGPTTISVALPVTQPPAAPAGVTSPALPLAQAPLFVPSLTSNLPPAGHADSFQPAWGSEAADRVFANLDAELSLALFGDGLAVPPRN